MATPIRSMLELAHSVDAALNARLADRPGWQLEPVQLSGRALIYAVTRGDVVVRLLVEPAGSAGPAAATGRSLRVLAPGATPDSRLFDELARAVVALDLELLLPEAEHARTLHSDDHKQDVALGGLLYNPTRTERRFQLFNLGLPRTATTSIAAMFGAWRAAHEFWCTPVVEVLSQRRAGHKSDADVLAVLRAREAAGSLEVDSASFLHLAVEEIVQLHPTAAYVLTWRPFEEWLDSYLGLLTRQARERAGGQPWPTWEQQMASLILGDFDASWFARSAALEPLLPRLATASLDFWRDATTRCLNALPRNTLVVPVSQLSQAGPALARLVGLPENSLQPLHLNASEGACERWSARLPAALKARAAEETAPLVARLTAAHDTLFAP